MEKFSFGAGGVQTLWCCCKQCKTHEKTAGCRSLAAGQHEGLAVCLLIAGLRPVL